MFKKVLTGGAIVSLLFFNVAFAQNSTSTNQDLLNLIKQLQAQIQSLQAQIADLQNQVQSVKIELNFNRALAQGATGDDVKQLQEFLKTFPDIYPEGLVTGYFGPITEAAVKKFQEQNGIESVGIVGPKTQAKLTELATTGAGQSGVVPPGLVSVGSPPSSAPSGTVPATPAIPATPAQPTPATTPTSTPTPTPTPTSPPPPAPIPVVIVSQNSNFGSPTFSPGTLNAKVGSYIFSTSPAESIAITNMYIQTGPDGSSLQNMKIMSSNTQLGPTISTISNNSLLTPYISITIPAGGTEVVDVYADIFSNPSGPPGTKMPIASISCVGRGVTSGNSASCLSATGQSVSISPPLPDPTPDPASACLGGNGRIPGLPNCLMPENLAGTGWNEVDNTTGRVLSTAVCSVAVCGRSGEWRTTHNMNGTYYPNGYPANSTYIQTPFEVGYWGQYYTNGVWQTGSGGIVQPGSNQIIYP